MILSPGDFNLEAVEKLNDWRADNKSTKDKSRRVLRNLQAWVQFQSPNPAPKSHHVHI